ncbi:MAG: MFS transporter, partial [Phototrophicales bacterium]
GGAFGIGIMGAVLSATVTTRLETAGLDASVSLNSLIDPLGGDIAVSETLRAALGAGISSVFVVAFIAAALGLLVTLMAPRGLIADAAAERGRDEGMAQPAVERR